MNSIVEDILMHYGMPRRSGRSGVNAGRIILEDSDCFAFLKVDASFHLVVRYFCDSFRILSSI